MRKKSRHATTAEIIACHELLTKYCVRHGDGVCHYTDGQTDATIAERIAPDLPESSVSKIRRELFGTLNAPAAHLDAVLHERVVSIEGRLRAVEAALVAVCTVHNRVAVRMEDDSLCVNQGLINAIGTDQ